MSEGGRERGREGGRKRGRVNLEVRRYIVWSKHLVYMYSYIMCVRVFIPTLIANCNDTRKVTGGLYAIISGHDTVVRVVFECENVCVHVCYSQQLM